MINGTLKLSAPISPYDDTDKYPTHLPKYGKGGYRTCKTISERDKIPYLRREEGMFVYCQEDMGWYILVGGTNNECWQDFRLLSSQHPSGFIVVSETEPPDPPLGMVWLNPGTGVVYFRNTDNSQWEPLIAQNVDGGSF